MMVVVVVVDGDRCVRERCEGDEGSKQQQLTQCANSNWLVTEIDTNTLQQQQQPLESRLLVSLHISIDT